MIMNNAHFLPLKTICRAICVCIAFIAITFSVQQCAAQQVPKKTLLALSKADHTLSVIDPVSFKILAKLPVGTDPHEVIASTDGKMAFVTIYGGGSLHELDVFDLVALKSAAVVDTK